MTDKSSCHGDDTLPLGIQEPSEREIDQARRSMRHAFVSAPRATGRIYGIDVEHLSETDKALAFDWLWLMLQSQHTFIAANSHVRPL